MVYPCLADGPAFNMHMQELSGVEQPLNHWTIDPNLLQPGVVANLSGALKICLNLEDREGEGCAKWDLLSCFLECFHPFRCLFRASSSKLELVFMVVRVVYCEHKQSPTVNILSPMVSYSCVRVNGPTLDRSLHKSQRKPPGIC